MTTSSTGVSVLLPGRVHSYVFQPLRNDCCGSSTPLIRRPTDCRGAAFLEERLNSDPLRTRFCDRQQQARFGTRHPAVGAHRGPNPRPTTRRRSTVIARRASSAALLTTDRACAASLSCRRERPSRFDVPARCVQRQSWERRQEQSCTDTDSLWVLRPRSCRRGWPARSCCSSSRPLPAWREERHGLPS